MKIKLSLSLFLFALAGQLASAQSPCPACVPFTASPASPSSVANEPEVFQFSIPTLEPDGVTRHYTQIEFFPFQVTTASAGETMDAGIYVVNSAGTSATLYRHTGPISLATTGVPASGYPWLFVPCDLGPYPGPTPAPGTHVVGGTFLCSNQSGPCDLFYCPNASSFPSDWMSGESLNSTGKFAFAMCSTGTTAQVMPWIYNTVAEPWPNRYAPTAYSNYFGGAWVQTEWSVSPPLNILWFQPPEIFKSPWASDSNWGTDATDVCVNGSLPSTLTLSNVTPN